MRRFSFETFALTAALAVPSAAQAQPYSQSMAQCAGVAQALAHWLGEGHDGLDMIETVAEGWTTAALEQAASEGVRDVDSYVTGHAQDMKQQVIAEGRFYVFSEDFQDWTNYCRKFGNRLGLDLTTDS